MQTENSKTVCFVLAAVAFTAVAWFTYPRPSATPDAQLLGKRLFPNFTDPTSVGSLNVLQFDQKDGRSAALEVAKVNNLWVLPTHGNYPADAKDHLAAAANALIDLKIIGLAPGFDPSSKPLTDDEKRKAYNQFGVIDPDPDTVKSTDSGVGTRITMKDSAGQELAAAIIGKPVPDQNDQCYLREVGKGKDLVYVVQLDPSKVSVKFADWIEPNLLNLNTMDLKQIHINDYSIERVVDPDTHQRFLAPVPSGEYKLDLPSGEQPWKLVEDLGFDLKTGKTVPRKLAADEELNSTALDGMKSALEDLKIVDVERKPASVPADLRVRSLDDATRETLQERGFYVVPTDPKKPDAPLDIVSKFGEIDLQMNDGARYVLRFGNTTGASSTGNVKDKKPETKEGGMDRYLFVMADFNQDAIPKPAVEQLPPEEKPAPKKTDGKDVKDSKDAKDAKKEEPMKDDAKKPAEAKADEGKKADAPKADAAKTPEQKADPKKDEPKKDDVVDAAEKAKLRKAEQERIDKENQRRQDEYKEKVAAGKKHVDELNKRFAQWYYMIPGDVYEKIHLDRNAIVKKKEPPKDAAHDHDHGPDLPTGPAGALNKVPEPGK
jgi:hypothetical protein